LICGERNRKENDMNIGEACVIFHDIDSDKYTVEQKGLAIKIILDMETHNSVTKAMLMKALKWLWNEHFEWKVEEHE
jgi:hypothetical protein